jgi:hypothetical protein
MDQSRLKKQLTEYPWMSRRIDQINQIESSHTVKGMYFFYFWNISNIMFFFKDITRHPSNNRYTNTTGQRNAMQ